MMVLLILVCWCFGVWLVVLCFSCKGCEDFNYGCVSVSGGFYLSIVVFVVVDVVILVGVFDNGISCLVGIGVLGVELVEILFVLDVLFVRFNWRKGSCFVMDFYWVFFKVDYVWYVLRVCF